MTCESIQKRIPLYLYGELSFEDEEIFEKHCEECAACRAAVQAEKRIHRAMDAVELRPEAELLERCRLELPRTLRLAGALAPRRSPLGLLRSLIERSAAGVPLWMKPAGAVALVALGFFAARYTGPSPAGELATGAGSEPVATQVRYVEPSDSGNVRIVLDETRQRELYGSLDDDRIQQVLLAAVRNPDDPGVRADSLELLKERSGSNEVRDALLYALESDPNDGVRLKALEGLRSFPPDAASRRVLSRVLLADKNPGVRSMAIDLLTRTADVDVVETLQELMLSEDNNYVRMRSQTALEEMNAPVETF